MSDGRHSLASTQCPTCGSAADKVVIDTLVFECGAAMWQDRLVESCPKEDGVGGCFHEGI